MTNQLFEVAFNVKLHSKLTIPTEHQLDGVGVDFVFPPPQLTTTSIKYQVAMASVRKFKEFLQPWRTPYIPKREIGGFVAF